MKCLERAVARSVGGGQGLRRTEVRRRRQWSREELCQTEEHRHRPRRPGRRGFRPTEGADDADPVGFQDREDTRDFCIPGTG
jgi:hypothetical protein